MIAIFGASGNMGKRYSAVCDYLNIPHVDYDVDYDYSKPINSEIDKVIIATPVSSHVDIVKYCIACKKDFLCEKPITKDIDSVIGLCDEAKSAGVRGFMVNNWFYVLNNPFKSSAIIYNHHTGNDGMWDLIQPYYYLQRVKVVRAPLFNVIETIGLNIYSHGREAFDYSYISMVRDFAGGKYQRLMSLSEAVVATSKVLTLIESGKNVY